MQQTTFNKPITIVTITYNSSYNLPTFLDSVMHYSLAHLVKELIVIDNNSSDQYLTDNIVNSFKQIRVIPIKFIKSKTNNGFARSCNLGASLASTKYILFLNPDTTINLESIQILYDHALKCKIDLIGGISMKERSRHKVHKTVVRAPTLGVGLFEFSNLGKLLNIKKANSYFYYNDITNLYSSNIDRQVNAVGGAYLMVKHTSFDKLNGFDENFFMYLEDVDLGVRAHKLGMKVIFCPHSKISHIGGESSNNKDKIMHQAWYNSRKYYFKKHHSFLINLLVQPMFVIEESMLKLINSNL